MSSSKFVWAVAMSAGCIVMVAAMPGSANAIDLADLIYDPVTGNVQLDPTEAGGGVISSFQFENEPGTFVPGNYTGPTGGTFGSIYEDVTTKVLGDSDLSFTGFDSMHDMGNVFPNGMDLAGLEAYLTTAAYTGALGTGQHDIDLVVIPEPSTIVMVLLALGLIGILRRRRTA